MESVSTRDAYGDTLLKFSDRPDIVVLDADLSVSTQTSKFAKVHPSRFIDVGCAEQNLMGVAAGLAVAGKVPFASTYAIFAMRAWEQIRNTIAHDKLPVKIAVSHAGLTNAPDGASHQSLEDLALMRAIPHMGVIIPSDAVETREVVLSEADRKGPAYIRLNRSKTPVLLDNDYTFKFGRAVTMREGSDVTIVATGTMVHHAIAASDLLKNEHIECGVVNVSTLKPFDTATITKCAKNSGAVISIEEHSIYGGLGGAVAESLATEYPVPMRILGVRDVFGESGEYEQLLSKHRLDAKNLVLAAHELMRLKK